ncbi:AAA family ATPase [Pseudomonas sp. MF6755]|uniref:AAA family ATPase n=1 Tax=Pseudomonas sp. MF6755 TaxID=2797530 RepID=UPI0018E78246|nr:ATP-binding protein [Pseudomonas sp. MF6755]MBJ2286062.1 AAA family ATPase [Pseudomonas sp. MF6755]
MISSVFLENFMRIHARTEIELGPVTVLVGANGSGKSSVLKGIHWAVRCAALRDATGKLTLEQMDYVPSKEYVQLAHKTRITNGSGSPKIVIGFTDENNNSTTIELSSARNDAGVITTITGPMSDVLKNQENHITSYIPGLAGLAETETLLATPVLHRKAASGEGGSVLRHMLLELKREGDPEIDGYFELVELNSWVSKVIPEARFWVKFDPLRDTIIYAKFWTPDMRTTGRSIKSQWKPLEMAGTGFLQIVQIFTYLLKFKSNLILIDEPDAHLHPGTQERLINALEKAAIAFPSTKLIISTHSPSLVRACGPTTRVHWMDRGSALREGDDIVKLRMGWGALDKDLILFTEDEKTSYLKNIISQWPALERKILIWPTFGKNSLPHGDSLKKLREKMKVAIMVHRDRDFMSDADVDLWKTFKTYDTNDIPLWVPAGSDIESAFCHPQHISNVMQVSIQEAEAFIPGALALLNQATVEDDFNNAINDAVKGLGAGKSTPSRRWRELGDFCQFTVKGKELLVKIKDAIRASYSNTLDARKLSLLPQIIIPTANHEICSDLKTTIEQALQAAAPQATPSATTN